MLHLDDLVDKAKGAGEKKSEQLQKAGVLAVANLVVLIELPEGFDAELLATLETKLPPPSPPTTPSSVDRRKCGSPCMPSRGDD